MHARKWWWCCCRQHARESIHNHNTTRVIGRVRDRETGKRHEQKECLLTDWRMTRGGEESNNIELHRLLNKRWLGLVFERERDAHGHIFLCLLLSRFSTDEDRQQQPGSTGHQSSQSIRSGQSLSLSRRWALSEWVSWAVAKIWQFNDWRTYTKRCQTNTNIVNIYI